MIMTSGLILDGLCSVTDNDKEKQANLWKLKTDLRFFRWHGVYDEHCNDIVLAVIEC